MKLSSLLVLLLISVSIFSQIDEWEGGDLRIGYRISTTKISPMLMRIEGDKITYINGKFSFGSTHLSGLVYSRNVYMDIEASLTGNLVQSELLHKEMRLYRLMVILFITIHISTEETFNPHHTSIWV